MHSIAGIVVPEHFEELRSFAELHAKASGMETKTYDAVLSSITSAKGNGVNAWPIAWMEAGNAQCDMAGEAKYSQREKVYAKALQYYGIGRFPYADDPERLRCEATYRALFMDCSVNRPKAQIVRDEVQVSGRMVPLYRSAMRNNARPRLIIMGGIVSLKEQWAPMIPAARRLGYEAVVCDFPGVGENPLRYDMHSYHLFEALINKYASSASTYVIGMSFAGHLALRAAIDDFRIKGITTVGAPLWHFFLRLEQGVRLPHVTQTVLEYVTGNTGAIPLAALLSEMALDGSKLSRIQGEHLYIQSAYDEIIPVEETTWLAQYMRGLRIRSYPDVHGCPNHLSVVKRNIVMQCMRWRGGIPRFLARIIEPGKSV